MSGQNKSAVKLGTQAPTGAGTGGKKKGGKCRGGCAHPVNPVPSPEPPAKAQASSSLGTKPTAMPEAAQDQEELMRKENLELKNQEKELEGKLNEMQAQLDKTNLMNTRLEGLCSELKNRTKALTEESTSRITEAEDRGKELTAGVADNLGLMNNINDSIQQITKDNLESRQYNENLEKQIVTLKSEQEKKEARIQDQIQETHDKIIKAHMELAQTKLNNSQDKEKTFQELKNLATAIVDSREQMQTIKQTELTLRQHIRNYDEKFSGLQMALKETNAAYDGFKGEMEKIAQQAKNLEVDAIKWQTRWDESNVALVEAEKIHAKLADEVQKTTASLQKMTSLYKALQNQIQTTTKGPTGPTSPNEKAKQTPASSSEPKNVPVSPAQKQVEETGSNSSAPTQVSPPIPVKAETTESGVLDRQRSQGESKESADLKDVAAAAVPEVSQPSSPLPKSPSPSAQEQAKGSNKKKRNKGKKK